MTDDKSATNAQSKTSLKNNKPSKPKSSGSSSPAAMDKSFATTTSKKTEQEKSQPAKSTTPFSPEKPINKVSTQVSKIAVFTLLLVIVVIAAMSSAFVYYQQQQEQLSIQFVETIEQQRKMIEGQSQQKMTAFQNSLDNKISAQLAQIKKSNLLAMQQLEQRLNQQIDTSPNDWLINEAEYLIRMASRSLWLHKDAASAIVLLQAADDHFKQTQQDKYLVIRQSIRDDITQLQTIPVPAVEDTVLSLLALSKQIANLTLAHVQREAAFIETPELSSDIADWRTNLSITWDRFVDDYFTLRPINATVQPLLTPEYQQNLRQNLALKVQLAIWAATEHKPALFQQTLTDITTWLRQYFDMEQTVNIAFEHSINQLNSNSINVDYTIELSALHAIQKQIPPQLTYPTDTIPRLKSSAKPTVKSPASASEKTPAQQSDSISTKPLLTIPITSPNDIKSEDNEQMDNKDKGSA